MIKHHLQKFLLSFIYLSHLVVIFVWLHNLTIKIWYILGKYKCTLVPKINELFKSKFINIDSELKNYDFKQLS